MLHRYERMLYMKKIISILLTLLLIVNLCACGNNDSGSSNRVNNSSNQVNNSSNQVNNSSGENSSSQKSKTVTLTTSNWRKYLHIEKETQNYNYTTTDILGTKFADGTADCVITVSNIVPCTCSNVVIELEISSVTSFWNDETKTVDIHVSSNGSASKSVTFTSEQSLPGYLKSPTFSYRVVSVSGTIQEN